MHVDCSHTGVGGGVSTGVLLPGSGVGRTHHHVQLQQVQQQLSQVSIIYTENDVLCVFVLLCVGCCCCCLIYWLLFLCFLYCFVWGVVLCLFLCLLLLFFCGGFGGL